MSTTPKTLEVKIRPYSVPNSERPDLKGASRVHLSAEALRELNLRSGLPCYLWKDDPEKRREAIAWATTEKNLNKAVVQTSKAFQEAYGFKLGDDVNICAAGAEVPTVESVILRDITPKLGTSDVPELEDDDLVGWEWYLRKESLSRAEVIFAGMTFKNVTLTGQKRAFVVDFVNNTPTGHGTFDKKASSVKISSQIDQPQINAVLPELQLVNIAGIDQALKKLNDFLGDFQDDFPSLQEQKSCAVLLHGGHGSGKTFLIDQIIGTGWGKVHRVKRDMKPPAIRTLFRDAKLSQPSIIVIDNLENLVSKEDSISESITEVLEEELDGLVRGLSDTLSKVLVVGATLNANRIPMSLRDLGRFDEDILLPIPDSAARKAILKSLSPPLNPDVPIDTLEKLGERTHAYTAKDLRKLLNKAYQLARRARRGKSDTEAPESFYLEQDHIEQALLLVRPTAMHDITLQPPSVKWDEIGGQENVKEALRQAVETPLLHPERMARLGGAAKKGILLYGPPGCSKTLSAQAMATEVGFNFFAVKGAELLNMYVGESERSVREIFARARAASPSIIFFDEVDAIGGKRASGGRTNGVNVLTTLLNEMDGIETLKGVMVLAATNQPQALDAALLRPGRFDQLIYVAPPDLAGREAILRVKQRKMDMADDVDIPLLAHLTEGYSGAEVVSICQTAIDRVLKKCDQTGLELQLQMDDFKDAVKTVKKQITLEMVQGYEKWARGARGDTD
ncbi:ATPase family protein [Lachnellula hyalina]|uniref:ATPase family protein n=1 Tax=Lachnellula hyalina TaxID=1316788 RepID=A0A8H8RBH8_9HELO|nr:ATPase family protein [Lachnellula hyalina]TVY30306.1 ATPase family protein [Lachnellula hyalina]